MLAAIPWSGLAPDKPICRQFRAIHRMQVNFTSYFCFFDVSGNAVFVTFQELETADHVPEHTDPVQRKDPLKCVVLYLVLFLAWNAWDISERSLQSRRLHGLYRAEATSDVSPSLGGSDSKIGNGFPKRCACRSSFFLVHDLRLDNY